jgi:hypothetical protein
MRANAVIILALRDSIVRGLDRNGQAEVGM